ncbi:TonB-dependent receptor [Porticoccus sp. W117]|uniref:TonB-dependent receptor n=1 Tax=Porticoccus sp. W117 TaxID=3054777 RepID=UPI0025927BBC|nr:TonB-dependent receptor [Porticoccus sp. W117]MDM3872357.1 TonB-dependent receptor [Porticoccus sp. W117]
MSQLNRQKLLASAVSALVACSVGHSVAEESSKGGEIQEEIIVKGLKERFGSGIGRAEYVLGAEDIELRPGGAEITQALTKIPGVQVSTGDSRGGSFSLELYLRGLNDQQIGLSVDGIPAGDARFNGGSPPNRYVESSNVGQITVSQSSGEIGSPSRSALGGFIDFATEDPKEEFGVEVELGTGDDEYRRNFLRVDTGEIAPGLSGYFSFSDQSNDIYTGPNNRDRDREHLDLKLVKDFGESSVSYRYSYNKLDDNDFGIVSFGDFLNDPNSDTVNDVFTGDPSIDGGFTGFGGALGGVREDILTYFNIDLALSDGVKLSINPYYHELEGESFAYQDEANVTASGDPRDRDVSQITVDGDGNPVADLRITPRNRERYGVTAELLLDGLIENNTIRAGFWFETDEANEDRNFFQVTDARTGIAFAQSALNYIEYERNIETDTAFFYVQDSISLLDDALGIDIGLTYHDIEYNYGSTLEEDAGTFPFSETIEAKTDGVDLKLGGVYRFTDDLEVFAGYSENFGGIFEDAFLGSSSAIDPQTIQAEQSDNIDLGIRYVTDTVALSLQAYWIDFENRLTTVPTMIDPDNVDDVINGNSPTQVVNQGGVDSKGIELTASYILDNVDLYATYSHQNAEWSEDDPTQGIVRGVQVQDIPEDSFFAEIGWSPRENVRFALNGKYVGTRVGANLFVPGFCNPFFCFDESGNGVTALQNLGVQELDSYWVFNFLGSYELQDIGELKNVRFQLNIDNLFDEDYIASVTGATSSLPEFGVIGGLDAESALDRYFISAPRTVTFSISAEF